MGEGGIVTEGQNKYFNPQRKNPESSKAPETTHINWGAYNLRETYDAISDYGIKRRDRGKDIEGTRVRLTDFVNLPDGKIATINGEGSLVVYPEGWDSSAAVSVGEGDTGTSRPIAKLPSGEFVTVGKHIISVWNEHGKVRSIPFDDDVRRITSFNVSPEGEIICGISGAAGIVTRFNPHTGERGKDIALVKDAHEEYRNPESIAISEKGKIVVGNIGQLRRGSISIIDPVTEQVTRQIETSHSIRQVEITSDEQILALDYVGNISLYNAESGQLVSQMENENIKSRPSNFSIAPDGNVVVQYANHVKVLEKETWKQLTHITPPNARLAIYNHGFTPDNKLVILSGYPEIADVLVYGEGEPLDLNSNTP